MFSHTPESDFDLTVPGLIRKGYGVASGLGDSPPYPTGTLALQIPVFTARGVDLSPFYRGTLNVDISPHRFALPNPDVILTQVAWTDRIPPEDFSFCACLLQANGVTHRALIYRPHPETKVEHFQHESVVEILAPFVASVGAGSQVTLRFRSQQVTLTVGS